MVTAKGEGLFLDGPASAASPGAVSKTLDQVGKPAWDLNNVKPAWPAVAGASLYRIDLYTPFGTFTYYSDTNSYDGDDLHIPPGGLYYYTVQALGSGIVFDGPVSDYSDILEMCIRDRRCKSKFNLNPEHLLLNNDFVLCILFK